MDSRGIYMDSLRSLNFSYDINTLSAGISGESVRKEALEIGQEIIRSIWTDADTGSWEENRAQWKKNIRRSMNIYED